MAKNTFTSWTGISIDALNMSEGDLHIEDIATSLSNQCRYNGHVNFHYSVAQHSVHLAMVVPFLLAKEEKIKDMYEYRSYAAAALMHDSTEAYMQDIITPNKHRMSFGGQKYTRREDKLQKMIFHKYGLDASLLEEIGEFDKRITENEKLALHPSYDRARASREPLPDLVIRKWTPEYARIMFLDCFNRLEIEPNESQN